MTPDEALQAVDCEAYGSDGEKIGKVRQVFLDDQTDEPAWATVNTGLFGTSESFVPLINASFSGDRLMVAHPKDQVKNAPNIGGDSGHLTPEQESGLYDYYGIDYTTATDEPVMTGQPSDAPTPTSPRPATQTTSQAQPQTYATTSETSDDAMTLSEERVRVAGTESRPVGRARLRKIVETEYVTQTVPVRREKVIIEHDPVEGDDDGSLADADAVGTEVVLNEERPVLEKTAEPVERVRLAREEYTEDETVSTDVRRERIETEGDVRDDGRRDA